MLMADCDIPLSTAGDCDLFSVACFVTSTRSCVFFDDDPKPMSMVLFLAPKAFF